MIKDIKQQLEVIKRGAMDIISEPELKAKLEQSIAKNKPLIVKAGFDPTAPDIHLGHTVLLRKLRQFQDLGHKVIFLIGDATALVGDPTGQSQTRKILTWDEVENNALTYIKQVSKILNVNDQTLFERRHNSEWFSRHGLRERDFPPFTFETFVELAQKYTVARLLERDDFQKRYKENKPISFLELFYPLMQGYDSYKLHADIEIGGTDQKFNLLVGRDIQQSYGEPAQVVITMPLLEGTDGVQKMSKSYNNYIGINEDAGSMFGKVMSISDEMMFKYYTLLTDEDLDAIRQMHPKEAKLKLGEIIVSQYHSPESASNARIEFERVFSSKQLPDNIEEYRLLSKAGMTIIDILIFSKALKSRNDARRLVEQGGVSFNGLVVTDASVVINSEGVLKIGKKHFLKIVAH